jgi:two-component system nitrate/nitrite response regulator NarP
MRRLIVADDHPLVLRGVEGLFDHGEFEIVGLCADGLAAMQLIERGDCDAAVLDIHMPGMSGVEILKDVRRRALPVKIVLLTSSIDDSSLVEVIRIGVDGLVLKEAAAEVLVACVKSVCAGSTWIDRDVTSRALQLFAGTPSQPPGAGKLTDRETEVARFVASGLRNKEIAARANISPGTVKMHLHNIYEKIGIGSRTELAMYVRDKGLA